MDADGSFGIRRSSCRIRNQQDCVSPVYYGRISLKQVQKVVPRLLQETFGGHIHLYQPKGPNRRGLWVWEGTCGVASRACQVLIPHLRIKANRAQVVVDLDQTKLKKFRMHSYWYIQEHPNWASESDIGVESAMGLLEYSCPKSISQALRAGTLLGFKRNHKWRLNLEFTAIYGALRVGHPRGVLPHPIELVAWKQRLWEQLRQLNQVGVNGTPATNRTGYFEPIDSALQD